MKNWMECATISCEKRRQLDLNANIDADPQSIWRHTAAKDRTGDLWLPGFGKDASNHASPLN